MSKLWKWLKVKWWWLWACEHEKMALDQAIYGSSMMKNGKRIPPEKWNEFDTPHPRPMRGKL